MSLITGPIRKKDITTKYVESFQLLSSQSAIYFFDQSNTHTLLFRQSVRSEEFPWRRDGCTFPSLVFTNHKWSLIILPLSVGARSRVCVYTCACVHVCVCLCVEKIEYAALALQPESQPQHGES